MEDGPSAWALHPHGRPGEAPGSWLQIGAASHSSHLGSEPMEKEDLSLCLSHFLTLPLKKEKNSKKCIGILRHLLFSSTL